MLCVVSCAMKRVADKPCEVEMSIEEMRLIRISVQFAALMM